MDAEAILNAALQAMAAELNETDIDDIQWEAGEPEEWLRQIAAGELELTVHYLPNGKLSLALD